MNDRQDRCCSFKPSIDENCRILILGSMPGVASLQKQQYYAFKYNAFWRIMADIYGVSADLPYDERLKLLCHNGVALWDVCGDCRRTGSLDSNIRQALPNDIAGLLNKYPNVRKICCNGTAAGKYLHKFFPHLQVPIIILPSTSPAAAALPYSAKLQLWRNGTAYQID